MYKSCFERTENQVTVMELICMLKILACEDAFVSTACRSEHGKILPPPPMWSWGWVAHLQH